MTFTQTRPTKYIYPSDYKPKGLIEQLNCLHHQFPGLCGVRPDFAMYSNCNQVLAGRIELPENAEGWFAIPNIWKKEILRYFGGSYSKAVQKVLDVIEKARSGKFKNYREYQLDEKHLRQSDRTLKFFRKLSKIQGDPDILIVPAQLGIRHRDTSVQLVREAITNASDEFGLGAFAVGIMLLTHPYRLSHQDSYNDLWISCVGDELDNLSSDVRFDCVPEFGFLERKVWFGSVDVYNEYVDYGHVTGFIPE